MDRSGCQLHARRSALRLPGIRRAPCRELGLFLKFGHLLDASRIGRLTVVAARPLPKFSSANGSHNGDLNGSAFLDRRFPPRTDCCFGLW